jgi:hypothetical protein
LQDKLLEKQSMEHGLLEHRLLEHGLLEHRQEAADRLTLEFKSRRDDIICSNHNVVPAGLCRTMPFGQTRQVIYFTK